MNAVPDHSNARDHKHSFCQLNQIQKQSAQNLSAEQRLQKNGLNIASETDGSPKRDYLKRNIEEEESKQSLNLSYSLKGNGTPS